MKNEKSEYVNGALGIYVTIHYVNGHEAHICVTADSLAALAYDVFKYILNH